MLEAKTQGKNEKKNDDDNDMQKKKKKNLKDNKTLASSSLGVLRDVRLSPRPAPIVGYRLPVPTKERLGGSRMRRAISRQRHGTPESECAPKKSEVFMLIPG